MSKLDMNEFVGKELIVQINNETAYRGNFEKMVDDWMILKSPRVWTKDDQIWRTIVSEGSNTLLVNIRSVQSFFLYYPPKD